MTAHRRLVILLIALVFPSVVAAQSTGMLVRRGTRPAAKPGVDDLTFAAGRLRPEHRHSLGELTAAERQRLVRRPSAASAVVVGVTRRLLEPIELFSIPELALNGSRTVAGGLLERSREGRYSWTTAIQSQGAGALRVRIADLSLPEGSRIYVYAAGGEVHGPYELSAVRADGFWSNSIFEDEIYLEAQLGNADAQQLAAVRLTIDEISHAEHENFAPGGASVPRVQWVGTGNLQCMKDINCTPSSEWSLMEEVSLAIAHYGYIRDGQNLMCSGGLLNNTRADFTPYFYTANHCIETEAQAASMELFWRYRSASCEDLPDRANFPRSLGATLLATDRGVDQTLVRLSNSPPGDHVLLPWDAQDDYSGRNGLMLRGISHPDGVSQSYARYGVVTSGVPSECLSGPSTGPRPRGQFIWSGAQYGAVKGGSSGSPVMLEDGKVVGALSTTCTNVSADGQTLYCDGPNGFPLRSDGALRNFFPRIRQYLAPNNPPPGVCTVGPNTLCLSGGRFRVEVTYATPQGQTGTGKAVGLTPDTGYFTFSDPNNVEVILKVLNTCGVAGLNNRIWVFAAGLTNVQVDLTVTDTRSGQVWSRRNPMNTAFASIQDTSAFATCP